MWKKTAGTVQRMSGDEACDASFQFGGMSLFGPSRLACGSKQRQGVDTEVAAVAEAEGQREVPGRCESAPPPRPGQPQFCRKMPEPCCPMLHSLRHGRTNAARTVMAEDESRLTATCRGAQAANPSFCAAAR